MSSAYRFSASLISEPPVTERPARANRAFSIALLVSLLARLEKSPQTQLFIRLFQNFARLRRLPQCKTAADAL
jgi:hypothetical protein